MYHQIQEAMSRATIPPTSSGVLSRLEVLLSVKGYLEDIKDLSSFRYG